MTFASAWRTKVEAKFEAKPLYVIGRAALIRNKRAAGRDKDLLDAAVLSRPAKRRRRGRR